MISFVYYLDIIDILQNATDRNFELVPPISNPVDPPHTILQRLLRDATHQNVLKPIERRRIAVPAHWHKTVRLTCSERQKPFPQLLKTPGSRSDCAVRYCRYFHQHFLNSLCVKRITDNK